MYLCLPDISDFKHNYILGKIRLVVMLKCKISKGI